MRANNRRAPADCRLSLSGELGLALMGVALLFLAFYAMGGFR